MQKLFVCVLVIFVFCSLSVVAQNQTVPPGGIVLLPGYQHERVPTPRDSRNGRIWKDQGLSISYQTGGMAGNRVTGNPNLQWSKEQTVVGNRLQIGLTRERMLIVVFSSPAP